MATCREARVCLRSVSIAPSRTPPLWPGQTDPSVGPAGRYSSSAGGPSSKGSAGTLPTCGSPSVVAPWMALNTSL